MKKAFFVVQKDTLSKLMELHSTCTHLNPIETTNELETNLLKAIRLNHFEEIQMLIKCGQGIDESSLSTAPPPLAYAIKYPSYNTPKIISLLLEEGRQDPNKVFKGKIRLQTVIQFAIECHNVYVVDMLVSLGADVNFCIPNIIDTPLIFLFKNARFHDRNKLINMADVLLRKGADTTKEFMHSYSMVQCLHIAIDTDCIELVRMLITYNSPLNPTKSSAVIPPLIYALSEYWENTQMIKVLIESGADLNSLYKTQWNQELTPIKIAIHRNKIASLKLLLENGADVNFKNDDVSPITCSFEKMLSPYFPPDEQFIQLLLTYGAEIDQKEMIQHFKRPLLAFYTRASRAWHINENILLWLANHGAKFALCTTAHNPKGILSATRKLFLRAKTIEGLLKNAEDVNIWDIMDYLGISDEQDCPALKNLLNTPPSLQCICFQEIYKLRNRKILKPEWIERLPKFLKTSICILNWKCKKL